MNMGAIQPYKGTRDWFMPLPGQTPKALFQATEASGERLHIGWFHVYGVFRFVVARGREGANGHRASFCGDVLRLILLRAAPLCEH